MLSLLLTLNAHAQTFTLMTEDFYPYNYAQGEQIKGLSVDVVREVLKKIDHPDTIEIYPWSRAYRYIQDESGMVLFSMVRNDIREHLFKWVGPIITNTAYFYKLKSSGIKITSLNDAKTVLRIGVKRDSINHTLLKSMGFENIHALDTQERAIRMLLAGRLDLIINNPFSLQAKAQKQGLNINAIEQTSVSLHEAQMYIAFSKDTPDKIIIKWQTALDDIKASPRYNNILKQYLPK